MERWLKILWIRWIHKLFRNELSRKVVIIVSMKVALCYILLLPYRTKV